MFTRRTLLETTAALGVLKLWTSGGAAEAQTALTAPLKLWYRQPAEAWTEALPIGNGRLGAMVFGGVARERLQLNEDTLYAGGPYDPSSSEALQTLPEVRRLIFVGKYLEAQNSRAREDDGAAHTYAVVPNRWRSAHDVRHDVLRGRL